MKVLFALDDEFKNNLYYPEKLMSDVGIKNSNHFIICSEFARYTRYKFIAVIVLSIGLLWSIYDLFNIIDSVGKSAYYIEISKKVVCSSLNNNKYYSDTVMKYILLIHGTIIIVLGYSIKFLIAHRFNNKDNTQEEIVKNDNKINDSLKELINFKELAGKGIKEVTQELLDAIKEKE